MSWVEAELREQPEALERFLEAEQGNAVALARELVQADVRYLLIASRGSSGNAARYAQYLFAAANRLPTAFATPSVYTLYETSPRLDGALAIAISQSGAFPDVVAVLTEARRQGRPTLAITNDPASPLAEAAEWTLPLHAGEERAVAATKTYLNSVAAVALLSAALARSEERLRELTGIAFEPWSPPDLLHGPIAALKPGRPVVVVAPSGPTLASMRDFVDKVYERGPEVIMISDDEELLGAAQTALPLVETVPEWLSPLLTVVPGQLAALRLATLRGIDVDRPLGLTKVTLTR